MISFATVDFETANQHCSSVCGVGVVVVRNGKVTDKLYRLIKPTPNFHTYWCTEVHGLTKADTEDAMEFPEVWAEIALHIQGLLFINLCKSAMKFTHPCSCLIHVVSTKYIFALSLPSFVKGTMTACA